MVNKKRKIVISGFILLIILGAATIVIIMLQSPKVKLSGTMYANDCGEPKGGFEWAAEYNVSIKGDTMEIRLFMGLGDYLEKHVYKVAVKEIVEKEFKMVPTQRNGLQLRSISMNKIQFGVHIMSITSLITLIPRYSQDSPHTFMLS